MNLKPSASPRTSIDYYGSTRGNLKSNLGNLTISTLFSKESAIKIPRPPAFVITSVLEEEGFFCIDKNLAKSKASVKLTQNEHQLV